MKSLQARADELAELKRLRGADRKEQAAEEAKMVRNLATDAESYAKGTSIPIKTSTSDNEVRIDRKDHPNSWIKLRVTTGGAGPTSYSVSSTDTAPEEKNEDEALEAILIWLQS